MTVTRHPALTIAIHWATAIAIVVAVAVMFARDATEDRAWRLFLLPYSFEELCSDPVEYCDVVGEPF